MYDLSEALYQTIHEKMPITCVDVIIKINTGAFLLIKRDNEPAKNQLMLVGGRVKRNERLEQAAKRKIKEELGI